MNNEQNREDQIVGSVSASLSDHWSGGVLLQIQKFTQTNPNREGVNMQTFEEVTLLIGMGKGHKNREVKIQYADGNRHLQECEGYPYRYYIRGSDYDFGKFACIEEGNVIVNFCGVAFSKEPLPFKDGWLPIRDYWWEGR